MKSIGIFFISFFLFIPSIWLFVLLILFFIEYSFSISYHGSFYFVRRN